MQSLCAEFITEPIKSQVQISRHLYNLHVHDLIAAQPVERSNFYSTSAPDIQE